MSPISRRDLLKQGAVIGGAALGGGLISACGGSSQSGAGTQTSSPANQKRGGILRVGVAGAGAQDTVDAHGLPSSTADTARTSQLYNGLFEYDFQFRVQPKLAESAEPNADATEWTFRLRDGLEWHNGKPITADDIIYTFARQLAPNSLASGAVLFKSMHITRMRKLDARTVRISLRQPQGFFLQLLPGFWIIPVGYDPKKPIGSGPFKFQSFTPGQESVFVRNENYFGQRAFVDAVKIIDLDDDTARVNALLSNQVDCIAGVPYANVKVFQQSASYTALVSKGAAWHPIVMRTDVKPFSDNRVREAIRLLANREQMVQESLNGFGAVANDLYSPMDPLYNRSIPQRTYDPERAKALLAQAGLANGRLALTTAQVQPGVIEACQVLAQNAAAAGLTITLNQVQPNILYNKYLTWPFTVDWFPAYLWFTTALWMDGPGAPYNSTHFADPEFTALFNRARREVDESKQKALVDQCQQIQHERGGYVIWGFAYAVSAYSTKVTGFASNDISGQDLNGWHLERASFV